MDQVIKILTSLGIDNTLYYQFGIFFFAFLSMKFIVFGPYLKAYNERMKRTVGGQEEAEALLNQAEAKENEYSQEAKKLNGQIKDLFTEQNVKAKKEVEQIMAVAKKEADSETEAARKELEESVSAVRREMENHIPSISEDIRKKFVRQ